ncbi:MAG TPA: hypothetical protein VHM19_23020 [Polyangiales bacterium]|jgi:hypothetical protein|nr:hypothetical protein [Polyangiales bacterium]
MRALTLHRPWDVAMLHGKLVENRSWKPPVDLVGQRFALHAGEHYDYDGLAFIKRTLGVGKLPEDSVAGVVFATTKLIGWVETGTAAAHKWGAIASVAEAAHAIDSPWLFGPVGWVLEDTRRLAKPVPCRGFQRLWNLPADVEARVIEQMGAAS